MTEEPVKSPYTFQATLRKALALHLIALCLWIPATQEASAAPQRVISTSPAITEILFALGAGDRVVGVTDFCSYPESACRLPSIGGTLNPSSEAWIGLKPDLIIHQADSEAVHDHAKILGIPTLTVSVSNLKSILTTTQIIADSLHTPKAGQQLVQRLKTGIDHYQSRLDSQTPKQVLLLLGDSNDPARDLYAVGKGTFLDELST
ncbi:MAG: helical backbone metal receptor, partial [Nitrospinaceae bacterium]|nr:helical backbone metal receptor [Nitrospinaceae bacterium]